MSTRNGAVLLAVIAAVFVAGLTLGSVVSGEATIVQDQQLSHFKCYPIAEGGTDPAHVVNLRDQFGAERRAVGVAVSLCTPVFKKIFSGPEPLTATGRHLKCYLINGQLQPPRVRLANQLGREDQVLLRPARTLCVPTQKAIIPPPTG